MAEILKSVITVIGIDIGKTSFHVVGFDGGGAVALRQKWSRGQVEAAMARGALRAVVATSSLDLGVDWAAVDLVIMGWPAPLEAIAVGSLTFARGRGADR